MRGNERRVGDDRFDRAYAWKGKSVKRRATDLGISNFGVDDRVGAGATTDLVQVTGWQSSVWQKASAVRCSDEISLPRWGAIDKASGRL